MRELLENGLLPSHMFIKILEIKDSMYECIKIRQGLNNNDNSSYVLLDWSNKSFIEISGTDLYEGIYNENKIYEIYHFINRREM